MLPLCTRKWEFFTSVESCVMRLASQGLVVWVIVLPPQVVAYLSVPLQPLTHDPIRGRRGRVCVLNGLVLIVNKKIKPSQMGGQKRWTESRQLRPASIYHLFFSPEAACRFIRTNRKVLGSPKYWVGTKSRAQNCGARCEGSASSELCNTSVILFPPRANKTAKRPANNTKLGRTPTC